MNAETQEKGKIAMEHVLRDVEKTLNKYVDAINEDTVDWSSEDAVEVVMSMEDMMMTVYRHMYGDKVESLPLDVAEEAVKEMSKFDRIMRLCMRTLSDNEEE